MVAVDPNLLNAAIFLGSAVVAVPLFRRLGLGAVLGYLAAGVAIGPHVFGLFADAAAVLHFAELGVVLLLFVIGLELRPARLWRLRAEIFGLGLAQVLITAAVIAVVLRLGGLGWPAAVAAGGALALSSTAFAVQLLRDRGELTAPHGDRAFSILLFQDLAIVPLLALVALISPGGGSLGGWAEAGLALGALAAVVLIGRFGLRPLFTIIAKTRSDEIFTAAALLVVIGAALLMQLAGLSMAMGAFMAGVLLAESEYRHQLETDIEPFRGLLLGLFFIGVGMSIDWPVVMTAWPLVIGGAVLLYLVKAALLVGLTRAGGSGLREALKIGALMGQGGEFAFVIFAVGTATGLWGAQAAAMMAAAVTISMALTPLGLRLVDWLRLPPRVDMTGIQQVTEIAAASVIVVGFGRFGQVVARMMRMQGLEITIIDNDPDNIRMAETFGNKVFFGDLARGDVLRAAGADQARAIFLCIDDRALQLSTVEALRHRFPQMLIFARGYDRFSELELTRVGADIVIREMLGSAVELAKLGLERLGFSNSAGETAEEFRRRDAELLRLQSEFGALGGYEKMRETYSLEQERKQV